MAITPTHLDSFRSASPSSIPPAADTLTGTLAAPASEAVPQTAFHRRFFGTEIEERLTKRLDTVQTALTTLVTSQVGALQIEVSDGTTDLRTTLKGFDANGNPVTGTGSTLKELDDVVRSGVKPQVDQIKSDLGSAKGDIQTAGEVIKKVSAQLETLIPKVGVIEADVTQIKGGLAPLATKVGVIEADVTQVKGDVTKLLTEVACMRACVEEIKARVCDGAEPTGGAPKPKKP